MNVAIATSHVNSQSLTSVRYCGRMDRIIQLRGLIHSRFEGNQASFAKAIGRSPSVIWQYLSGHRRMGEDFARHIERRLGLPRGWMDDGQLQSAEEPATYDARHSTLIDLFEGLTASQQKNVIKELQETNRHNEEIVKDLTGKPRQRGAG